MLEIEFATPATSTCECCGGTTTTLTRFITIDDEARAAYFARFSDNHPEHIVSVLLSLGEWWDGAVAEGRIAFGFNIWESDESFNVGVVDAETLGWPQAKSMGTRLTREEALAHPLVKEAFHVSDHIVADDPEVRAYFQRASQASGPAV
jgi:hypothetical protein